MGYRSEGIAEDAKSATVAVTYRKLQAVQQAVKMTPYTGGLRESAKGWQ
jgi:hypothetical protein